MALRDSFYQQETRIAEIFYDNPTAYSCASELIGNLVEKVQNLLISRKAAIAISWESLQRFETISDLLREIDSFKQYDFSKNVATLRQNNVPDLIYSLGDYDKLNFVIGRLRSVLTLTKQAYMPLFQLEIAKILEQMHRFESRKTFVAEAERELVLIANAHDCNQKFEMAKALYCRAIAMPKAIEESVIRPPEETKKALTASQLASFNAARVRIQQILETNYIGDKVVIETRTLGIYDLKVRRKLLSELSRMSWNVEYKPSIEQPETMVIFPTKTKKSPVSPEMVYPAKLEGILVGLQKELAVRGINLAISRGEDDQIIAANLSFVSLEMALQEEKSRLEQETKSMLDRVRAEESKKATVGTVAAAALRTFAAEMSNSHITVNFSPSVEKLTQVTFKKQSKPAVRLVPPEALKKRLCSPDQDNYKQIRATWSDHLWENAKGDRKKLPGVRAQFEYRVVRDVIQALEEAFRLDGWNIKIVQEHTSGNFTGEAVKI
ncbi:MAG: hypothetical protein NTW50_00620 [Candidatus Berkelbacteria bacterium]|nr:hypothetical protein [Candidatus Berkelbacteria bacterium]